MSEEDGRWPRPECPPSLSETTSGGADSDPDSGVSPPLPPCKGPHFPSETLGPRLPPCTCLESCCWLRCTLGTKEHCVPLSSLSLGGKLRLSPANPPEEAPAV